MAINSIGGVSDNILEGPFGSDKSIQYNNNGVWAGSTSLVWDSNNTRLGVGITTPLEALDVNGVIQANSSIKTVVGSGVQAQLILEQSTVATWEIYNPASSTNLLLKNTTDLFTFTSSGRLGIGVTNPNRPLHIQGNVSAGNVSVDLENTNTGGAASVNIIAGNASGVIGMNGDTLTSVIGGEGNMVLGNLYTAGGSDTGGIAFISGGNVERMRLDKQGNLGIAVTPSSWSLGKAFEIGGAGNALWYSAQTVGDILLRSNAYYNSGNYYGADGWATQLKFNNNGGFEFFTAPYGVADAAVTFTNRMTIYNDGNVGIGENVPTNRLFVRGDNNVFGTGLLSVITTMGDDAFDSGNAGSGILLGGKYDSAGNQTTFAHVSAIKENTVDGEYGGALIFHTRPNGSLGEERMRITSDGNVAIGDTAPTNQKLLIREDGGGNYPILEVMNTNTTASAKPMIRVGTGGDAVLELYRIGNAATTYINAAQTGNGNLAFQTEGNTKMVIANNGNVGIGVTNPTYALDISGTMQITSNYGTAFDPNLGNNNDIIVLRNQTAGDNNPLGIYWATGSNGEIRLTALDDATNGDGNLVLNMRRGGGNREDVMFWEGGTGNVGIGVTNPTHKLHLSTSGTDGIRMNVDSQPYWHLIRPNGDGIYLGADEDATGGSGADIRFAVKGVEIARMLDTGGITFNGDTADANALDDYEEGTWTPTLGGSTTDPTVIFSILLARYTKIGNLVTVTARMETSTLTGGVGQIKIEGLPYTQANSPLAPTTFVNVLNLDVDASCIGVAVSGASNSTYFSMYESKDNASWSVVDWTQVPSSSFGIWFTAQYYV